MKKVFFILCVLFIAVGAMAQNGKSRAFTTDTVKGAETVNFDFELTDVNVKATAFVKATNIGGTTNEVGLLKFSTDGTTYFIYSEAHHDDGIRLFATDTTKIANNGASWTATTTEGFGVEIDEPSYKYWRIALVGEASDTTQYTGAWAYKKK